MKFLGFVLVVLGACGEVTDPNKLPDAPTNDAPIDGTVDGPDVDAPPPRCDPAKPFGTPVAVTELDAGNANDFGPSLTPDELTLTFGSSRSGGVGMIDVYISTRASKTAAWGAPVLVNGVNTTGNDSRSVLTGDQLSLYIEYQANPNSDWNVVVATRATTTSAFSTPTPVTPVNTLNDDTAPYVLPDHSAMYLVNTRMLYRATHSGTTWSAPALVTGTSLQAGDFDYPVATPDELTIYFSSSRGPTTGGNDIWKATRATVVAGFNAPTNVTELNSTAPDSPSWVSADNCIIYFTRNVGMAASDLNIFRAEKPL